VRAKGPPTPDLILLDVLRPMSHDGDGWHFIYRWQQLPDLLAIPVVIVTAPGNASPNWAESLGAVGLLRKPVDGDRVVAEVRRRVDRKRQPARSPRRGHSPDGTGRRIEAAGVLRGGKSPSAWRILRNSLS
jgi:DNA-binding response OmpR family regulator